jgi:threonine/homoserine/homoserine lactone efflux protein
MTLTEIALASLALLITPGPTNTLVFLAGAERGFSRALRLIPAELAGYLAVVVPLALVGATVGEAVPGLKAAVALAAGVWVAVLAARLWRVPTDTAPGATIGPRALFVTTALNPKALIFGLVLLPSPAHLAQNLATFTLLVVAVAGLWAAGGALLRQGGARRDRLLWGLRRAASVWLGLVSITLMLRGVAA